MILTERRIEASTIVPMACLNDRSTPVRSSHQGWWSSSTTNASGAAHYYFNDHLGAPILQTDAAGTVVWRVERDPYGERYATRVGGERHQPLGLPGQEYDESAPDRQYNVHRWYRPSWGRYTQPDPIALAGGINLFTYAQSNPLIFIDPTGLGVVNVSVTDEKRYSTLDEYRRANPCKQRGSNYACTERLLEDIGCICSCKGTGWGMDVQVNIKLRYHLSGRPSASNKSPAFYWSGYRKHEDLHTNHLKEELSKYAESLEEKRYNSPDECNADCDSVVNGFRRWLNDWAIESNRKFR